MGGLHCLNIRFCAQSGSGGAGATAGWAADLSGMGSAFGGMQLSNSAGIVRRSLIRYHWNIMDADS